MDRQDIAQTPPMGWNSWNTFYNQYDETIIRGIAKSLVSQGFRDSGYNYLILDDCWSLRERDGKGRLVPDPAKFPHGLENLIKYVHSLGLKFGIYSCCGVRTCAGNPGSFEHEVQDAEQFACCESR